MAWRQQGSIFMPVPATPPTIKCSAKEILKEPDKYEQDPNVVCVPFQEITQVEVRDVWGARVLVLTRQDSMGQETYLSVLLERRKKEWTRVSPTQLMLWRFWLERQAVWEQALEEKVGLRDSGLASYVATIRAQGPVISPAVREKCEAELQKELQSRMKDKSVGFDEILHVVEQRLAPFAVIPWCAKRTSERADLLSICAEPSNLWKEFILLKLPILLDETF
jgi:hypothetical protein